MVTDFSDVNDASFNQDCYEGAKEWAKKNKNITFDYLKPSDISVAERIKSMNLAIDRGQKRWVCLTIKVNVKLNLVIKGL